MTVKELGERMDAVELMEWMSYFMLQDEKEMERLSNKVNEERDATYHQKRMKNLFSTLIPQKKKDGKDK